MRYMGVGESLKHQKKRDYFMDGPEDTSQIKCTLVYW